MDDYIPTKLNELAQWLRNFALVLENKAAFLGIKPEDVERVKNDALFVAYLSSLIVQARAMLKGLHSFKNQSLYSSNTAALLSVPPLNFSSLPAGVEATSGIIKNIRQLARRIKAANGYTNSLGIEFGIVMANKTEKSLEELFPPTKIEALENDFVQIKFKKYRHRAVRIEMRREEEESFSLVGIATHSPFLDETKSVGGRAEVRYYRLAYFDHNKITGVYSPVFTISTRP